MFRFLTIFSLLGFVIFPVTANATMVTSVCKEDQPALYKNVKKIIIYHEYSDAGAPINPIGIKEIERLIGEYAKGLRECPLHNPDVKIEIVHEPVRAIYDEDNLVYFIRSHISKNTTEKAIPYEYKMMFRIYRYRSGFSERETFDYLKESSASYWYFNVGEVQKIRSNIGISLGHYFFNSLTEWKSSGGGIDIQ